MLENSAKRFNTTSESNSQHTLIHYKTDSKEKKQTTPKKKQTQLQEEEKENVIKDETHHKTMHVDLVDGKKQNGPLQTKWSKTNVIHKRETSGAPKNT